MPEAGAGAGAGGRVVVVVDVLVVVSGTVVVSATVVVGAPVVVVVARVVVVVGGRVVVVVGRVVVVVGAVVVVVGGTPVPASVLCSWFSEFQTTWSCPVAVPTAVGVKITVIVHGAVVVPNAHVPPRRENGPLKLIELRVTDPLGVNVAVCGVVLCPTSAEPRLTVAGVSVGGVNCAHAGPAGRTAATAPTTRARMLETATGPPYARSRETGSSALNRYT
jgi:hypothetical protein